MSEYSEMISKINEIINELRNHECENDHCCVKSLLEEMVFNE